MAEPLAKKLTTAINEVVKRGLLERLEAEVSGKGKSDPLNTMVELVDSLEDAHIRMITSTAVSLMQQNPAFIGAPCTDFIDSCKRDFTEGLDHHLAYICQEAGIKYPTDPNAALRKELLGEENA